MGLLATVNPAVSQIANDITQSLCHFERQLHRVCLRAATNKTSNSQIARNQRDNLFRRRLNCAFSFDFSNGLKFDASRRAQSTSQPRSQHLCMSNVLVADW